MADPLPDDENNAEVLWMRCVAGLEKLSPGGKLTMAIGRAFDIGRATERERCAWIAEILRCQEPVRGDHGQAWNNACEHVARRIREAGGG